MEAGEHDKRMAEDWKEDAMGLLVFTGLFSATVAAFLIESSKKLSPSAEERSTFHLSQISQQLADLANGTNVPPPQAYSPSLPTLPIVWVNTLWLLSLVFSLTSALVATLVQQWARRY
ncbi:hypothetical protein BC826DRAFT_910925, partial [Russula brevipes]